VRNVQLRTNGGVFRSSRGLPRRHEGTKPFLVRRILRVFVASWLILFARGVAAADQYGRVTFSDQPVPGATLTATRGDVARVTVTDGEGIFHFADLTDGPWTLQVEMLGFSTLRPGGPGFARSAAARAGADAAAVRHHRRERCAAFGGDQRPCGRRVSTARAAGWFFSAPMSTCPLALPAMPPSSRDPARKGIEQAMPPTDF
jgi:hypothetical protein